MTEKGKFLMEIKSVPPANAGTIKQKSLEKVLVVWTDDETGHSIPFSQSLIQSKALTCFIFVKVKRSEEVAELKLKASRVWFMRLKERTSAR